MRIRTSLTGLIVAAIVVAGIAWVTSRDPATREARPAAEPAAAGAVAIAPAAVPPPMTAPALPGPLESAAAHPETTNVNELVTLDPPPETPSGPTLESTGTSPDVTTRDELVTVPVDSQPASAGRPERTMVPPDLTEPPRRDELTDAPLPGQGNTSTR